jgi:hypothetical protein
MEGAMSLKHRSDDEVRRALFDRVVDILETERTRNHSVAVCAQSPCVFSIQRPDGCLLMVDIGNAQVLMRGQLKWCYVEHQGEPWSFSVARADDVAVRMVGGPTGSIDEIAEYIKATFLNRSKNVHKPIGAATLPTASRRLLPSLQ